MIPLALDEIARATGGRLVRGDAGTVVRSVTTDSRRIGEDALFVALVGENADGHDFAADAASDGAVAVLTERPVEADAAVVVARDTWEAVGAIGAAVRDRVDPLVVGITGSVGKTTTKDLTAAALGAGRRTTAARGSYNNELGVPLTLLSCTEDTEALVVEVGARGVGHIARLTPIVRPDIAIVTAVAAVHIELFGDLDAVTIAKGELVECLGADGTAILNGDDPRVTTMADRTDARVLRYGVEGADRRGPAPDLEAFDVRLDRVARASFRARTPWGECEVRLPVAGRHQVGNSLAALAAAGTAGVDLDAAAAALADAPISSWRGEVVEAGGAVLLNDAYNANPTSVAAALDMLTTVERTGRTFAVLGVMAEIGDAHDEEHARIGRLAIDEGIDRLVVVGDAAAPMAAGARDAGADASRCRQVDDADAALELLRGEVGPGDVVLVKASRVGGLEKVATGLRESLDGTDAA